MSHNDRLSSVENLVIALLKVFSHVSYPKETPESRALLQKGEISVSCATKHMAVAKVGQRDKIKKVRLEIERQYEKEKWKPWGGMSFDEILCFELHSQPENPRAFIGQLGLTFKELAEKWQIPVAFLGDLIADHCHRL